MTHSILLSLLQERYYSLHILKGKRLQNYFEWPEGPVLELL